MLSYQAGHPMIFKIVIRTRIYKEMKKNPPRRPSGIPKKKILFMKKKKKKKRNDNKKLKLDIHKPERCIALRPTLNLQ